MTLLTLSVAWQQERHWFTQRFGEQAWYLHLAITTPIWGVFLVPQGRLGPQVHRPVAPELKLAGVALGAVGIAVLLATSWQLGLTRTFNGYSFGRGPQEPVSGGVFGWLRNPMYDSFWILFVAAAFWLGNAVDQDQILSCQVGADPASSRTGVLVMGHASPLVGTNVAQSGCGGVLKSVKIL